MEGGWGGFGALCQVRLVLALRAMGEWRGRPVRPAMEVGLEVQAGLLSLAVCGGWWCFSGGQVHWWWWLVGLSASVAEGVQLGENPVSVLCRTSDGGSCGRR
jgi:hypothetical protein